MVQKAKYVLCLPRLSINFMLKKKDFTFIDLFSGIGGFRLALNNLGGSCLNFSEINKDAIDAYCTNFEEETTYNLGDITTIKALPKARFNDGGCALSKLVNCRTQFRF